MLIGIDASRAAYPQRTGTENYSFYLIRALLELDTAHRFRLYSNARPEPGLFAVERAELRTMPFPRLWTHLRLSLEMAVRAPQVLFVPAHVLPLVHPRHSVVTVHDLGYIHYPEAHRRWDRWYLRWSTLHNARHAVLVIADSQATKRDLVEHCGTAAEKIHVIYPGADHALGPQRDPSQLATVRERYGLPGTYVIHVGTYQPRKNLSTLLEAFAVVAGKHTDVHLALVGKRGWLDQPLFEKARQLGIEPRVHFAGYVPNDDLATLLTAARVFAMPSLYEGFGFPVLEAMACKTAVICSDSSSLPEVAGDAALLVDPHDARAWAESLDRLLSDEGLRAALIERGLRQVARFSWAQCAQETLAVLEAAVIDHREPRARV
jgi:glycosyltransferase involved in cell wall biosynthesis